MTKKPKKLLLDKKTVRVLTNVAASAVVGGFIWGGSIGCPTTTNETGSPVDTVGLYFQIRTTSVI